MFFFFMQKTAYELRISDWSSDVCSSYLIVMPKLRFDAGIRDVAIRIDQRLDDLARARWRETPVAGECDHEEARTRACKRLIESKIGRASCRERMCTYV